MLEEVGGDESHAQRIFRFVFQDGGIPSYSREKVEGRRATVQEVRSGVQELRRENGQERAESALDIEVIQALVREIERRGCQLVQQVLSKRKRL